MSVDPLVRPERPTPESLSDSGRYRLAGVVEHGPELVAHVNRLLRMRSAVSLGYVGINLLCFAAIFGVLAGRAEPWADRLAQLGLGFFAGYLLLVPVHEGIHALAYRALGSRTVSVHYRWRSLSAYCVADRFVVSGPEFVAVCLAPFVVITSLLAVLVFLLPAAGGVLAGALLLHTGACSGDFAFVNWVWLRRGRRVLTYDAVAEERSYFFEEA